MKWRWFGPGVAGVGDGMAGRLRPRPGLSDSLSVGQREEDLVARKGQPQEIQPEPGGGKTYVYTTSNIDQMATSPDVAREIFKPGDIEEDNCRVRRSSRR